MRGSIGADKQHRIFHRIIDQQHEHKRHGPERDSSKLKHHAFEHGPERDSSELKLDAFQQHRSIDGRGGDQRNEQHGPERSSFQQQHQH